MPLSDEDIDLWPSLNLARSTGENFKREFYGDNGRLKVSLLSLREEIFVDSKDYDALECAYSQMVDEVNQTML